MTKDYEPEATERHTGNHGKKIVTFFGEILEIKHTYYWNEEQQTGQYSFDDRMGLIGRYTPTAANEMIQHDLVAQGCQSTASVAHALQVKPT